MNNNNPDEPSLEEQYTFEKLSGNLHPRILPQIRLMNNIYDEMQSPYVLEQSWISRLCFGNRYKKLSRMHKHLVHSLPLGDDGFILINSEVETFEEWKQRKEGE